MTTGNSDGADQKKAAEEPKDDLGSNETREEEGKEIGEISETAPALKAEQNINNNDVAKGNLKDDSKYSEDELEWHSQAEITDMANVAAAAKSYEEEDEDDGANNNHASNAWTKKRSASARPLNVTVGAVAVPGINASSEPTEAPQSAQIGVSTSQPSNVASAAAKQDDGTSSGPRDVPEFAPLDFPDDRLDAISDYAERERAVQSIKMDGIAGGYAPTAAAAAAAAAIKENPSVVDTDIDEPPFNPELIGDDGRPAAIDTTESPAVDTNVDEPPFIETPMMEEETEPNNDNEVAAGSSQMQHHDLPLISARLVTEESSSSVELEPDIEAHSDSIIVEAQPLKREHICQTLLRSRVALCGIVTLLLVVAGLGIGLGVTLGSSDTTKETSSPTSSPTATPLSIDEVRDVILDVFPSAVTSLNETRSSTSPRRRALQWVLEDPSVSTYDEKRIVQRWILATYYYAMSGDLWKKNGGWLETNKGSVEAVNECLWFGLSCNETDDLSVGITSINMDENGVDGTLPVEIAWFNESLLHINLKDNKIKGPIPTEFGRLSKLKRITTRINDMTGPIPTELGLLKDLEVMRVDQNNYTGKIPSELGLLDKLSTLNVRGNNLCGDMPQEICDLRSDMLETLQADCSGPKINCTCCTKCWEAKNPNCAPNIR